MPLWFTSVSEAVEPSFQTPLLLPVRIKEPLEQKVVLPIAEITAAVGSGFTVTEIEFEVTLPQEFVVVT